MKHIELGTRVKIVGITDIDDKDLNGVTGTLCRKFPLGNTKHVFGEVGVRPDPHFNIKFVNVMRSEVREII